MRLTVIASDPGKRGISLSLGDCFVAVHS